MNATMNLTPQISIFRCREAILKERKRLKKQTYENRRKEYQNFKDKTNQKLNCF